MSSCSVVSYDQRSLSTRLTQAGFLSLQSRPCATQHPGTYGGFGAQDLADGGDIVGRGVVRVRIVSGTIKIASFETIICR